MEGGEERDRGILKGKYKTDHQLCIQCLFSQSCWVVMKKEKESCDWREGKGEAGFIKVLLDEWVPREERDGLEGGKG